ncbi:MAG TPA: hypothetical protein VFF90_11120 [Saprospiraceae bacterium]|nr:hypothetical protein [Saprospiraceae bacterium]
MAPFLSLHSQYYYMNNGNHWYKVDLNATLCSCDAELLGGPGVGFGGPTFSPEGDLYYLHNVGNYQEVRHYDTLSGNFFDVLMQGPFTIPLMAGFVGTGNGIFYSMPVESINFSFTSDMLYRWDSNTNTVSEVGPTGFIGGGDMCKNDGQYYYITVNENPIEWEIIHVDLTDPANSSLQVSYPLSPNYWIFSITASPICNTLIGDAVILNIQ